MTEVLCPRQSIERIAGEGTVNTKINLLRAIVVIAAFLVLSVPGVSQTLCADASTTIQQAIADAHNLPPGQWVTIIVQPGDYFGPVIVDRPRTQLIANSVPIFRNGVLVGHNPAVTIHPPGNFALGTVGIIVNNGQISGFDVDGGGQFGISAYGIPYSQPGTDDLNNQISGVQIIGNVIANAFVAIQIIQASAVINGNTSMDNGHAGIVVSGGPTTLGGASVVVTGNVFNKKNLGANFFGDSGT
jgi:hypothetical protein